MIFNFKEYFKNYKLIKNKDYKANSNYFKKVY